MLRSLVGSEMCIRDSLSNLQSMFDKFPILKFLVPQCYMDGWCNLLSFFDNYDPSQEVLKSTEGGTRWKSELVPLLDFVSEEHPSATLIPNVAKYLDPKVGVCVDILEKDVKEFIEGIETEFVPWCSVIVKHLKSCTFDPQFSKLIESHIKSINQFMEKIFYHYLGRKIAVKDVYLMTPAESFCTMLREQFHKENMKYIGRETDGTTGYATESVLYFYLVKDKQSPH